MSTHNRRLDKICVVIVAVSLLLTVLFMNGESLGITMIVDEDAESYSGTTYFTTNDQNSDWDTEGATVITLTGDGAEISGNGAYVNGQEVVITEAGRYVISGSLSDGKITVDAHNSSKVWILLDGVDINCSDDACIRVDQAEKVFLTLAENSVNTLTSGSTYSDTALQDGTDGAIFAHDDLTINGSGSLTVTAEYRHGIAANDDLVITGGTITITAAADAIHANDSVSIKEAQITVDAGDDGIVTANEVEEGYMYIESGTIDITSVGDGIHTTGDITITGGSITIAAGDDGIHSDQFVYIEDGEILINECYEGIEALIIDVSGGDITIYPEDDGFNANGGSSDMFGFGGGPGQGVMQAQTSDTDTAEGHASETDTAEGQASETDPVEGQASETDPVEGQASVTDTASEETYIAISGGTITIINDSGRDADGLDSNEDIRISGGTIYISLLGTGSNCAVDYGSESGGVAEITGGTIIACGASSMAEGFSSTSTQASILYNTSTVADEGTTLALEDGEGNVLLSWEVPCSFSSALISCPDMQVGNNYQIVIGDSSEEITIEEISTSYGDAQSGMAGGGMGGGNMGGGMQPGGGFEGWPFNDTTEGTASEDSTTEGSTAEDSTENAQGDMPAMPEGMQEGHRGPGGHGGRGNGQTPPDMSQDGATEMQTPPDMNQDGTTESQTPPDMSQDGTTESQTPPDMSQDSTTESQTPPDMSQDGTTEGQAQPEMHDGQTGGPMMGEQGQQETSQEAEDQAEEQTVTAQTVDAKTLTIYGGCAALLIAAIAVSMMYKRH